MILFIRNIFDNIKLGLNTLIVNPLRSFLASLGVMVGISIVILMGWVLEGLDNSVSKTFEIIGVDMLYVTKWDWTGNTNWKFLRSRKNITLDQTEMMKLMHNSAEYVIPNVNTWGKPVYYDGFKFDGFTVVGTSYQNAYTPAGETLEGRYFTQFEDEQAAQVVTIGYNIYKQLFPEGNATGKFIKIGKHKYEVIGVVKKRGTFIFDFIDNQIFIPLNSLSQNFGISRRSLDIGIKAGSKEKLDQVRTETIGLMRTIRDLKPNEKDDFSINETKAFEENIKKIRYTVWGVGIGLTLLSFIVGVIGIMNIMLVSVSERTKEIGLRKALGAKKGAIRFQFLVESSVLTLMGAGFSIIGCLGIINIALIIVKKYFPDFSDVATFFPPFLSPQLVIVASVVSVVVGILSGLIPAIKASSLDPVEALRSE
ncbi:ABC transporter permease [Candidatus Kapabacteria bacterium]|nr:ABC transporter permease [Candidatus Kapabacteria bacterium]